MEKPCLKKMCKEISILTTDKKGNQIGYTIDDIQKEIDNDTEFGRKFKEAKDRVREKTKQICEDNGKNSSTDVKRKTSVIV